MHACTIIARNYLSHARVLAKSFRSNHPTGRFTALILDDLTHEIGETEPFEVIRPSEIMDIREFHRMAMLYNVVELSTAVKPWLLQTLLGRGSPDVIYLDPDIQFFAPIDDVSALAREHSIVLTPHVTEPIPNDGCGISEQTIMLSGTFNLGFIAVSSRASGFLTWWQERLARDCRIAHAEGRFVDQRYIDLVPALFDHYILRDGTVNVAYWNAYARHVEWTGEHYEIGGRPLRFYHFSGFDLDRPWLLSKHQGEAPRVLLSQHPGVARLCRQYEAALIANGYRDVWTAEYALGKLPGGAPITPLMRRLYECQLDLAEKGEAEEPPDPFDNGNPITFVDWLNEPSESIGISRYLLRLWRERPDIQEAFPDLGGQDAERYLCALIATGESAEGLPSELLPTSPGVIRDLAPPPEQLEAGVNVVGYLTAELGIGEAARQLVGSLAVAGVPHSTVVHRETASRQDHKFHEDGVQAARFDTNLLCINADRLPQFAHNVAPTLFDGRYSIGVWWWEVSVFPEELHEAFDLVDEIWVGSEFVREAISASTSKPVLALPLPVSVPEPPAVTGADLGIPEGFLFLFVFDFFSVMERKNPLAVVEAFTRAFQPGEGPHLLVKSINGHHRLNELERLRAATQHRPDITILDAYLEPEHKIALTASCDCYVSLHRSEGFGLTMAEAMSHGKPVIATAYGGNLDFMTEENSYLVPYQLVAVGQDARPYPSTAMWAEPDLDAAARLMREVYVSQDKAREVGNRARQSIRETHSPERAAELMLARLTEIRDDRRADVSLATSARALDSAAPESVDGTASGGLEQAAEWLHKGPANSWSTSSRFGFFGRFSRRLLRRALRPYEIREREYQIAVVAALKEEGDQIRAVEAWCHAIDGSTQVKEEELRGWFTRELETKVANLARQLDELGTGMGELQSTSVGTTPRIDGLEYRSDQLGAQLRAITADITQVARASRRRAEHEAHARISLVSEVAELATREASTKHCADALAAEVTTLAAGIQNLLRDVSAMTQVDGSLASRLENVMGRIELAENQVKDIATLAEQSVLELAEWETALTARIDDLAERTAPMEGLGAQNEAVAARIDRLAEERSEWQGIRSDMGERLDQVTRRTDELAGRSDMLARRGDELAARSEGLAFRSEQLAARNDDLVAHSKSVAQRSDELSARTEQLGDHVLQLAGAHDLAASELDTVRAHLRELSDRLHATPYVADPSLFASVDEEGRPMIGYTLNGNGRDPELMNDYRAFEDVFRGPEPFIRERQRYYVDLLRGHAPVLDVGCGRGEMLGLLAEADIPAVGVDLDPGMVDHCRDQGLSVELGDALDYLETHPSGTLGAIFSAQVIEHLSYEELIRLFTLAHEKLVPSGVFIAETVNPHAVHAFKAFWVDPTHRVPIFPEVAVALCRFNGFRSAVVRFPNGNGELEHDRRNQGEYAVVAQKAPVDIIAMSRH